jgi:hypothetical protein
MPLADTLLRLAARPRLYLPRWTDQIMVEVSRNLQENFGVTEQQTSYRESELRKHFAEAWVEGYEDLIPAMTNHPKDRHVLDLKDFPRTSLAPYEITAQGPGEFLKNLFQLDPAQVMQTLEQQAAAIDKTFAYLLSRLRINVPDFVETLVSWRGAI